MVEARMNFVSTDESSWTIFFFWGDDKCARIGELSGSAWGTGFQWNTEKTSPYNHGALGAGAYGSYYIYGTVRTSDEAHFFVDRTNEHTESEDWSGEPANTIELYSAAGSQVKLDWILCRKYVAGYNPHGTWGAEEEEDTWYSFAFLIWGTQNYLNSTNYFTINGEDYWTNNATELILSENVSDYIYDLVYDTKRYAYAKNFWGDATQQDWVYNRTEHCEKNYNYTAIFYKGHSFSNDTMGDGYTHWFIYDNESGIVTDRILDKDIYASMSTCTHDFVFLWTCFVGGIDTLGAIDGSGNSWGMLASWMGMNGTEMNNDGYANPDGSDHCFISFENVSVDFCIPTGFDSCNFGHFAYLFFDYELNGPFTIREALDAAAEDTCNEDFGATELYNGYSFWYSDGQGWTEYKSYLRVYGDGAHILPS